MVYFTKWFFSKSKYFMEYQCFNNFSRKIFYWWIPSEPLYIFFINSKKKKKLMRKLCIHTNLGRWPLLQTTSHFIFINLWSYLCFFFFFFYYFLSLKYLIVKLNWQCWPNEKKIRDPVMKRGRNHSWAICQDLFSCRQKWWGGGQIVNVIEADILNYECFELRATFRSPGNS